MNGTYSNYLYFTKILGLSVTLHFCVKNLGYLIFLIEWIFFSVNLDLCAKISNRVGFL